MPAKIIIFLIVFIIMAPTALAYEASQANQPPVLDTIKSIFGTTQLINVPFSGGEAINLISGFLQQIYQTVSGFLGPIINQVVGQLLPNILNR